MREKKTPQMHDIVLASGDVISHDEGGFRFNGAPVSRHVVEYYIELEAACTQSTNHESESSESGWMSWLARLVR